MRSVCTIVLLVPFFTFLGLATADEPSPPKSNVVMEKKLEYAQDILKALMNEDFDRLERDVKLMKVFTRLEGMYGARQPGYREQLAKFQDSVTALSTSVIEKNHETASKAYLNMVRSCIDCHKIIKQ